MDALKRKLQLFFIFIMIITFMTCDEDSGDANTPGWSVISDTEYKVDGGLTIDSLRIDGAGSVNTDANGRLTSLAPSDIRYKNKIRTISKEIDVVKGIKQLRGVFFYWDNQKLKNTKGLRYGEKRDIGCIAQEVEKVLPEIVRTDSKGYKSLDYPKLSTLLIEVSRLQQNTIENLKKENKKLMKRLDKIEKKLNI